MPLDINSLSISDDSIIGYNLEDDALGPALEPGQENLEDIGADIYRGVQVALRVPVWLNNFSTDMSGESGADIILLQPVSVHIDPCEVPLFPMDPGDHAV